MNKITAESELRAIALAHPATIRVFEQHGLDYCCGGRQPLAKACEQQKIDVARVVDELTTVLNETPVVELNFTAMTPTALVDHINQTHHVFVRTELSRIRPLVEKVAAKHGPNHAGYRRLPQLVGALGEDLLHHLAKEEMILFPYIVALEQYLNGMQSAPHACFSTVASPVQAMVGEHEAAGALLAEIRKSTDDFVAPADACPTLVGLLHSLHAFEQDLHQHIHLENNLLFPRAIELEARAQNEEALSVK